MKKRLQFIILIIFLSSAAFAQGVVTGVIKAGDGSPLVGATVAIKGSTTYAVADVNGKFSIAAAKTLPFTLQIKSVGYKSQEIEVYELSDESFEISLTDDSLLDEVVVTSRRREETVQNVPIPISVLGGEAVATTGSFNVNRVKELIPS